MAVCQVPKARLLVPTRIDAKNIRNRKSRPATIQHANWQTLSLHQRREGDAGEWDMQADVLQGGALSQDCHVIAALKA